MQIVKEVTYFKAFGFTFDNALGIHKAAGFIIFGHDDEIFRCAVEGDQLVIQQKIKVVGIDESMGTSCAISFMANGMVLVASSKQAMIYKIDADTGRVFDKAPIEDNNAKIMTFTTLQVLGHHSPVLMTRDHNGFNLVNLNSNYI
eukprot:CAMPEP_0176346632 /NCGR_PEP_ID=MMETSP0126-20121128/6385_1 /TAXON_ID=141414 ORGANISM="Strombidinopsis acuminatum, Strain SPMC142" /NCGR_SAMPLE_ID=MMETSP0126 /ASSEMBLY_ACC=CAM_ASM_000229 /LENGTH=144 /DNA_ID=CAMNT_0017694269 /DNA_START=1153 /DNA_END=1587 /DNA_ORIENTATION=-